MTDYSIIFLIIFLVVLGFELCLVLGRQSTT
jgi:hypothetical protein